MITKYIRCEVPAVNKANFSKGQSLWQETANSEGFRSQLGGWELSKGKSAKGKSTNDKAIILAHWQDMESVKSFMKLAHDPIADKTKQACTYSALSVSYLSAVMDIPASNQDYQHRVESGFIRIADCYVAPDKADAFIQEQESLWNPGMQQAKGMLGGELCLFNDEANRFLVISYWQSESHHHDYITLYFPALKQQAATDIIQTISGHNIQTEPSWKITA
jgi:quinol monooxygenase YgiN